MLTTKFNSKDKPKIILGGLIIVFILVILIFFAIKFFVRKDSGDLVNQIGLSSPSNLSDTERIQAQNNNYQSIYIEYTEKVKINPNINDLALLSQVCINLNKKDEALVYISKLKEISSSLSQDLSQSVQSVISDLEKQL